MVAPPEVVRSVPAVALAVYAHPDDPEVSCGGTLARWASEGCDVHVLICTRGEKGSDDPSTDREELARVRAGEVAAAGEVLAVTRHVQLGIDDGELCNAGDLRGDIVRVVRAVVPEVVLCPDPTAVFFGDTYFNHSDHRAAGWAALDAISPAAANPHYFPDAGPPHKVREVFLSGTLEPNAWVDIGDVLDAKIRALRCHASQLGDNRDWVDGALRQRAEEAGSRAGLRYAEEFRRLTLAT